MSDWRVENAKFTKGAVLYFTQYTRYSETWDHDHCEACWAKFIQGGAGDGLTEGYCTKDRYRWICAKCFRELKDAMGWSVA